MQPRNEHALWINYLFSVNTNKWQQDQNEKQKGQD